MTTTLQAIASAVSKLRSLLQETRKDQQRIQALQETLTETLNGFFEAPSTFEASDIQTEPPALTLALDAPLWKETVSLIATGRILGVAAQADEVLNIGASHVNERNWIADGTRYVRWVARGAVIVAEQAGGVYPAQQLLGKSLGIGYPDELVDSLTDNLILKQQKQELFYELISGLSAGEQRHCLRSLMNVLEKLAATADGSTNRENVSTTSTKQQAFVAGSGALLQGLLQDNLALQDELVEQIMNRPVDTLLVRASILALSTNHIRMLLERSWQQFGDKLTIKHKSIVQQEANARVLLLTAGLLHRSNPMDVFVSARSSNHTNAVSSRLASSSTRVRWLGMVVGMAISSLVDKDDNQMDFDVADMKIPEALWYRSLVRVEDHLGLVKDLVAPMDIKVPLPPRKNESQKSTTKAALPATNEKQSKPRIVEVVSSDEEDDALASYTKPDSDASDSEEDATLVHRHKPKAPVYILDLISGLADNENHDRHLLALKTAPTLIRRKADFGAELMDRAEELAFTIVSLQDTFELDDFHEMQQAAMIAIVVAQPKVAGPWSAKMFFTGDYSIAQRALILTSVGLGCRELAGLKSENVAIMARQKTQDLQQHMFPSKQLPAHLHQIYAPDALNAGSRQIDAVTHQLEQTMLRPVATKQRPRTRILRNDLAGIVADAFFFPLSGNWQAFASSNYGRTGSTNSSSSPLTNPTLLSLFIKTLALLFSAAGNATMALPQMTNEFWNLLLSLRSRALGHPPLLEATLFGFLTILDVNEQRRVAERDATALLETREWVGMVWEKLESEGGLGDLGSAGEGAGDESGSKEVQRCKYLAAGVLVRIKEIVDEYQRIMAGHLVRF